MKTFSIITVCLNAPKLECTCESIVNQSFQNFEWVVIDGGSDQETLNVLEKYKYRMDYFVSEKDDGVYDAMNKGIRQAHGDRLNFLNAGDSYTNFDVLRAVGAFTHSLQDIDVIHGKIRTHDGVIHFCTDDMAIMKYSWMIGSIIPHPATFYKRNIFERFGMYRTDYKIVSDYAFNLKIFLGNCSFKHLDDIVANFSAPGLSSPDNHLHIAEKKNVIEEFFSKEEFAEEENKYKRMFEQERIKKLMINLRDKVKRKQCKI